MLRLFFLIQSHLLPAKYSPQPVRHQIRINQQTSPHLPLSANERMLLAAKQGKKDKPPNYMEIPYVTVIYCDYESLCCK